MLLECDRVSCDARCFLAMHFVPEQRYKATTRKHLILGRNSQAIFLNKTISSTGLTSPSQQTRTHRVHPSILPQPAFFPFRHVRPSLYSASHGMKARKILQRVQKNHTPNHAKGDATHVIPRSKEPSPLNGPRLAFFLPAQSA